MSATFAFGRARASASGLSLLHLVVNVGTLVTLGTFSKINPLVAISGFLFRLLVTGGWRCQALFVVHESLLVSPGLLVCQEVVHHLLELHV